ARSAPDRPPGRMQRDHQPSRPHVAAYTAHRQASNRTRGSQRGPGGRRGARHVGHQGISVGSMPPKILIVDDTVHNVKMLADLLAAKGYAIVTAASGQEGLEKVEAEQPDLVLLDVMMPGMDGYEVCRRIRANPEYGILPVLLVTVLDSASERI